MICGCLCLTNNNQYGGGSGYSAKTAHHCIEIVLIDSQVAMWGAALDEMGFQEVFSFFNSNSKNTCHVFMMETNKKET